MTAKSETAKTASGRAETASQVLSDLAASAAEGFRQATQDASEAAERTAPAIKRSVSKGAYTVAYFLSFGVVYSAEVVVELLPEDGVIRQGLRDGAAAARAKRASDRSASAESTPAASVTS
jgi:hypothetical protein